MTNLPKRVVQSDYMHFAKTKQSAPYNLAISGMTSYPLSGLPVSITDLEINGPNGYGYPPLLEALAHKCGVRTENIVTTFGTSMANYLAMAAVLNPGDEILMEEPIYELMTSAAGLLSARIRSFSRRAENGFCLDPEDVRKSITRQTRMVVITNLHNPSSSYSDEDALRAVGTIAGSVGAYVLVDEVYLDAMFEHAPKTALHLGENFIVTNSLTKVYGLSGIRCGWVLANPELTKRIWRLVDITYGTGAFPPEQLSVTALRNLHLLAKRSKTILDANHALLDQFLASRNDLFLVNQRYGTVVFPKLLHGTVDKLDELLRARYETSIVNGRFFGMPDHFRLGICGETPMFAEGLNRLASALDEMKV